MSQAPDPTRYRTPGAAIAAPPETLARWPRTSPRRSSETP